MNDDKGWLEEVFKDVNEDVKSWPKWLKDEQADTQNHNRCADQDGSSQNLKAKSANAD